MSFHLFATCGTTVGGYRWRACWSSTAADAPNGCVLERIKLSREDHRFTDATCLTESLFRPEIFAGVRD